MEAIDPNRAIKYIQDNAQEYADAKAARVFIEAFLKTVKAQLMSDSDEKTLGAQETFAYAHPRYVEQLNGLKAAVAKEEHLKYMLEAAKLRIEVWKTEQYNMRVEMKM